MSQIVISDGASRQSLDVKSYPDGMPIVSQPGLIPMSMLLRPASFGVFVAAMFYADALYDRYGARLRLVLPFIPGARQDRATDAGNFLFTLKSVAAMINARQFESVTVLDPHSDVAPALIERCRVVSAADCITTPPGKYAAVVSPDAGAEKRAAKVAAKLGVPLLHAWKTRDIATGALSGFGMEPHSLPADSLVLVVDDICDGGGTFLGLADTLDAAGLRAHLWTTHGLYSQGTRKLLQRYGHIYCTDSVLADRTGVIEIKVCEGLL